MYNLINNKVAKRIFNDNNTVLKVNLLLHSSILVHAPKRFILTILRYSLVKIVSGGFYAPPRSNYLSSTNEEHILIGFFFCNLFISYFLYFFFVISFTRFLPHVP